MDDDDGEAGAADAVPEPLDRLARRQVGEEPGQDHHDVRADQRHDERDVLALGIEHRRERQRSQQQGRRDEPVEVARDVDGLPVDLDDPLAQGLRHVGQTGPDGDEGGDRVLVMRHAARIAAPDHEQHRAGRHAGHVEPQPDLLGTQGHKPFLIRMRCRPANGSAWVTPSDKRASARSRTPGPLTAPAPSCLPAAGRCARSSRRPDRSAGRSARPVPPPRRGRGHRRECVPRG